MAKPAVDIDVCNLALDRLGQQPITTITTPVTVVEFACARHYDEIRRELLRDYIFNFARKYGQLSKSATEVPAFGYSLAFPLPPDFIRLMGLGDVTRNLDLPGRQYDISNGFVYTDDPDADVNTLNILYVSDFKTVTKFDPLFIKVFKLRLAQALSYKFTLRQSFVKNLDDELKKAELAASAVAGQEKPPRRIERSKFRDVRRQRGRRWDPTRV